MDNGPEMPQPTTIPNSVLEDLTVKNTEKAILSDGSWNILSIDQSCSQVIISEQLMILSKEIQHHGAFTTKSSLTRRINSRRFIMWTMEASLMIDLRISNLLSRREMKSGPTLSSLKFTEQKMKVLSCAKLLNSWFWQMTTVLNPWLRRKIKLVTK